LESKVNVATPATDGAVTDRLLKITGVERVVITLVPTPTDVNATLFKVKAPELVIPEVAEVKFICDVPALKVLPVAAPAVNALLLANEIVIVDAFKFTVLVVEPAKLKTAQLTA
jgi:hypothetical protein